MLKTDYAAMAPAYAIHRSARQDVLSRLVASLTSTSRVLEVGCGTGNYIMAVERLSGCQCFGLDPEPAMLDRMRDHGSGVIAVPGRAERLEFVDGSLDLVFTVDVIHHMTDRAGYFEEAFRVLRPEARVCTTTDSEWVIRNRQPLSKYWPETVDVELRRYPKIEDLKDLMARAGFVSINEELVEDRFHFTDSGPFRDKVFSSLRHLDHQAFERGLAKLDSDLAEGPVLCIWRYVLLWGTKPMSGTYEV